MANIKFGAAAAVAGLLSACAPTSQRVSDREHGLLSAGFVSKPADTPAREAMLKSLPAGQFIRHGQGDTATWAFADPSGCGCVYIGSSQAYEHYKLHRSDLAYRGVSNTVEFTDPTHEVSAYGPWGSRYDFATTFGF